METKDKKLKGTLYKQGDEYKYYIPNSNATYILVAKDRKSAYEEALAVDGSREPKEPKINCKYHSGVKTEIKEPDANSEAMTWANYFKSISDKVGDVYYEYRKRADTETCKFEVVYDVDGNLMGLLPIEGSLTRNSDGDYDEYKLDKNGIISTGVVKASNVVEVKANKFVMKMLKDLFKKDL